MAETSFDAVAGALNSNSSWQYIGIFTNGQVVQNIGNYKAISISIIYGDSSYNTTIAYDIDTFINAGLARITSQPSPTSYASLYLSSGNIECTDCTCVVWGALR